LARTLLTNVRGAAAGRDLKPLAGGLSGTVEFLRQSLRPGGVMLVGEPYWRQEPADQATVKGCHAGSKDDLLPLPGTNPTGWAQPHPGRPDRTGVPICGYAAKMARELLAPVETGSGAVLARERVLPLSAPLAGLFPEGALRRGSTVVVGRGAFPGTTSLALALLSGPCAGGSWCAVVGVPDLGLVAAAQLGLDLERLAVVPCPGPRWAVVTAALLEGFDMVLLRPGGHVSGSDARKLEARARERGSVLAVMGDGWPGTADVRLAIVAGCWRGIEDGPGYLWGREVDVVSSGRGAATRQRRARTWLGGPLPEPVAAGLPVLGPDDAVAAGTGRRQATAGTGRQATTSTVLDVDIAG